MKLLLFDIDGTLLLTHGLGRSSLQQAVRDVLGEEVHPDRISFSGKTDPRILRELLAAHDIEVGPGDAAFAQILETYIEIVRSRITPERVEVLPGVPALVEHLHADPAVHLAVVTGNLEATAQMKLEAAGLDRFFPFGAYGSDSEDRNDLPPLAVERARSHTGLDFDGGDVVVVGDTEHDIVCSRGIGARSVGVCTGFYTRAALLAHAPDVLLEDLTDLELFSAHVLGS